MLAASKALVVAGNVTLIVPARPHRLDADGRDEIAMLLCGGGDLKVQCVMPPNADRQAADEHQQCGKAEPPSTGTTAAIVLTRRPLNIPAPRRILEYAMFTVGHLELLRKDAQRGFAVVAFAQYGEEVRHDEQGGRCCEQKAADD